MRNGAAGEANAVHLETTASPGDDAKFYFPIVSSGVYAIVPYAYYGRPSTDNISFNPHGGFSYNIGFWSYNVDQTSRWHLEQVFLPLPEPTIVCSNGTCTISCSEAGVSIYYTTDGSTPTAMSTPYGGSFAVGDNVLVVKAIAYKTAYSPSPVATLNIQRDISSLSQIASADGWYRLTADVSDAVPAASRNFNGRLDGNGHTVSGLTEPLFASLGGEAQVCNLNLSGVSIAGSGNTGAVAGSADGNARIYNVGLLSGQLSSSSGYCGGIVGLLDGSARVVNCFSFANITGGTSVGGIVGYNNVASSTANLKTMVMNCMFYANVSGTTVSPIYGGQIIDNSGATGLNNYNYYSAEDFTSTVDVYNCALGAEKRFLQRFEFYRQILNSNRELAAWYVFGTADDARTLMYKWVLDKAVAPYPILKPQGKYTSIINYDATDGEQLGTLSVTISDVGSNAPTGATISTSSLTLARTGKDTANYNFNYDKVQLPYYNDIGTGNYTDNKVVTGWEITAQTGGTAGTFYLSGMFRPDATVSADNAECYISGGRFDELAGAGQQQINGNVSWQISYADIRNFYGGGINDAKPITGSINVDIRNSNVEVYCGGPKFGDMTAGQVVVTNATDCTFGRFFGAGYGGTSYNRVRHIDKVDQPNYDFDNWADTYYKRQYSSANSGIATSYEYELFAYAGFGDDNNVGRFYVNYASLSLATTYSVTSTLTGCTVLEDFYGGGNLGKVNGNTISTLTNCTVKGNVFGAGFSAAAPTVEVMPLAGFATEPHYDGNSGFYTKGVFPTAVTYTWKQVNSVGVGIEFEDSGSGHYILTTVDTTSLGTVVGNATLTVEGSSQVGTILPDGSVKAGTGNVYGGGNEGVLQGNSTVVVSGSTVVYGNVYGGGNLGRVGGNTKVVIRDE